MMSNGPWSDLRSFQSGSRSSTAAAISVSPDSTNSRWKPSLRRPRRPRRSWACCWRSTWAPNVRSARLAFLAAQTSAGTSRTIATASTWCLAASSISDRRAAGWTLVASTTVSLPAARRLPAMKCSTSKASLVADWSF